MRTCEVIRYEYQNSGFSSPSRCAGTTHLLARRQCTFWGRTGDRALVRIDSHLHCPHGASLRWNSLSSVDSLEISLAIFFMFSPFFFPLCLPLGLRLPHLLTLSTDDTRELPTFRLDCGLQTLAYPSTLPFTVFVNDLIGEAVNPIMY